MSKEVQDRRSRRNTEVDQNTYLLQVNDNEKQGHQTTSTFIHQYTSRHWNRCLCRSSGWKRFKNFQKLNTALWRAERIKCIDEKQINWRILTSLACIHFHYNTFKPCIHFHTKAFKPTTWTKQDVNTISQHFWDQVRCWTRVLLHEAK